MWSVTFVKSSTQIRKALETINISTIEQQQRLLQTKPTPLTTCFSDRRAHGPRHSRGGQGLAVHPLSVRDKEQDAHDGAH